MINTIIPAYLYLQYSDDSDLQAFIAAFNSQSQSYLDWFNSINLPIYTGDPISGTLLDWVAQGLYGLIRPVLPSGINQSTGTYNTYAYNTQTYNTYDLIGPSTYYATNDDVFKRVITWCFYKGDGFQFNIRWLKRRIERFLNGVNGTAPNIDETYQISVSFGVGNIVSIRISDGVSVETGGAIYNDYAFNTLAYNSITATFMPLTPLALAPILQAAIDAGVLPLPFQYTYVVTI